MGHSIDGANDDKFGRGIPPFHWCAQWHGLLLWVNTRGKQTFMSQNETAFMSKKQHEKMTTQLQLMLPYCLKKVIE